MPTLEELGRKVKAKFPGQYDDLSDIDLATRVKAKHPGAYDDFTSSAIPPNPSDSIPAAKPPVPTELQGPAPSRLSRAVTNLPYSAFNSVVNTLKGPQMGGDDTLPPSNGDNRSGLDKIGDFLKHPIDNTLDWAADDPVGAAQQAVMLGKGAVEAAPVVAETVRSAAPKVVAVAKGAAQGAKEGALSTSEVPGHSYAARAAKALGVDKVPAVASSAVLGKYGAHLLFGPEAAPIGEAVGAVAPIVRGAWRGGKQALEDLRTPPSVEVIHSASWPPEEPATTEVTHSASWPPAEPPDDGGGWTTHSASVEKPREDAPMPTSNAKRTAAPAPAETLPSQSILDRLKMTVEDFNALPADGKAEVLAMDQSIQSPVSKRPAPPVDLATPPSVEQAPEQPSAPPMTPKQRMDVERAAGIDPRTGKPMVVAAQEPPVVAPASGPAPIGDLASHNGYSIPKDFGTNEASGGAVLPGHTAIRSKGVHSAGFNPETGVPEIHFNNGGLYRYPNLPPQELTNALADAPSMGSWVREKLRGNPIWHAGYQKVQLPNPSAPALPGVEPGVPPAADAVAQAGDAAPVPQPQPPAPAPPISAAPAPRSGAEFPPSNTVVDIPTNRIKVDPARFQFKANVGQGGAGEELRGVQSYDPKKGGVLSVWRDPADGETYVANGHNRLALATRTGAPTVRAQYLDAANATDARTQAALINIAEGRGDAVDAAKVFRDSGMGAADLEREGISLKGEKARQGLALANLDPHLFGKVISGELPVQRATIIGEGLENPNDQRAIYDLIQSSEKGGKRLTDGQIGEMIRLANGDTAKVTEVQGGLFGAEEVNRSLIKEKAEVSDYIRSRLAQEKRLFAAVGNESAASRLGDAGNVIRAGDNAQVATHTAQAQALYDKLSTSAGGISDTLNAAAQRIAGGENANAVKEQAYGQIRNSLVEQARALTGARQAPSQPPQGDGSAGVSGVGAREHDSSQHQFSGPQSENPVSQPSAPPRGKRPKPKLSSGNLEPGFPGSPEFPRNPYA